MNLGTVKNHGFDVTGHERRERLEAVVECDTCGKDVLCWSDTETWTEAEDGRWAHSSYGAAQGVCHQTLYVSSSEGCFRYKLEHLS